MQELFNLIQPPIITIAICILVKVAIKISVTIKMNKLPLNTLESILEEVTNSDTKLTPAKQADIVAKHMGIGIEHFLYKVANIAFGVSMLYMAAMVIWWAL